MYEDTSNSNCKSFSVFFTEIPLPQCQPGTFCTEAGVPHKSWRHPTHILQRSCPHTWAMRTKFWRLASRDHGLLSKSSCPRRRYQRLCLPLRPRARYWLVKINFKCETHFTFSSSMRNHWFHLYYQQTFLAIFSFIFCSKEVKRRNLYLFFGKK